ncbi:MAG: acyltransferase domain-containing protein [Ectothiorhodospiraceae bacterium]|nr:acyltransferase domain-containing protein [Ectothiorhodospiraceae bacterium]
MMTSPFSSLHQSVAGRDCRRPIVFLFSGQGSQYYHMARTLYHEHDDFRRIIERLDRQVQQHIGESMLSVLYDTRRDKGELFDDVRFSHPAIFCVQYALAEVLRKAGLVPDYVLGMSLGEFVAAAYSGVMTLEQALDAVLKQALTIEQFCPPGGMLAILGSPALLKEYPDVFSGSELAGVNYEGHFVIAGHSSVLERIQQFLHKREALYQLLPVKYGFHSTLIDPAQRAYLDFLKTVHTNKPLIPVFSCYTGTQVLSYSSDHFWQVARKPMWFSAALQVLEAQSSKEHGLAYVDLGPGGTLANFVKRSLCSHSVSSFQSVITPFDQEVTRLQEMEKTFLHN